MSFAIKLQTNTSEVNKLDKTITDIRTYNGTLKDQTSILDPVIVFEASLSELTGCNYMTIDSFGRSYFVTDIRSISNSLVQITAHVDVLSTYKQQILSNKAVVARNENRWNLYVDDGVFRTYQDPEVYTHSWPDGFITQSFVMAVAGG